MEQCWPIATVVSDPIYTKKNLTKTLELTTHHWDAAADMADVLKPILILTELLSKEENVSLSGTIHMPANLRKCHLAIDDDDSPTPPQKKKKKNKEKQADRRNGPSVETERPGDDDEQCIHQNCSVRPTFQTAVFPG